MPLTPEAKKLLAETIRGTQQAPAKGLRAKLLASLRDEAERRYRFAVPLADAGLDEAHRRRRERIEAWLDERARASKPKGKADLKGARERFLEQAIKEAAATLINRHVLVRHLEAMGLSKPAVVTGGWGSHGYRQFREFAPGLTHDETEGYATLLQLLYDELALDLPGLFGDVGLARLFPVPPAMLREVVERFDDPALATAWTDDTTLGWVYQYWNDPDREALDAKIAGGGKIEPHEIASKTQMFTERYMVEWLLQNSLGLTWLCMCKKHGWVADAERVLPDLDARRAKWRQKREAGEVELDALMPIEGELEEHWKYYVPQPLPEDTIANAPDSVRALKLLDPACGSGYFLVIAFGLLAALYREEARHRGESITSREIAEAIVENNLYGIDIDPRAVQLAAAGLYLKARAFAKDAHPKQVNLVAPVLALGNLPANDPALTQLRDELEREVGLAPELTDKVLRSLAGVDHLGSLLKVDAALDETLREAERGFERDTGQGDLFGGYRSERVKLSAGEAKATLVGKLEGFLARHSKAEDLGLRLDGEQLAAGVRFVRMAEEGMYDIVVGNPPYQSTSKMADVAYVAKQYPQGKADLYAAFLERGLQFATEGGISALLTMRGWMSLTQYEGLRKSMLHSHDIRVLADVGTGAFSSRSMDDVISAAMLVVRKRLPSEISVALQAAPLSDLTRDSGKPARRRSALLAQVGRYEFDPRGFNVIEGEPVVYWWSKDFLQQYKNAPKIGDSSPAMKGLCTGDNVRFNRYWHEVSIERIFISKDRGPPADTTRVSWVPTIKGADGAEWFEPLTEILEWNNGGLQLNVFSAVSKGVRIQNVRHYFELGVAFTGIGSRCAGRAHRYASVFGDKGASFFPTNRPAALSVMNSSSTREIVASLNPSISFTPGDIDRLPIVAVPGADVIYLELQKAFDEHERHREPSVEFHCPGPSSWISIQGWAQCVLDQPTGTSIVPYRSEYQQAHPVTFVSFTLGVALGRFGAHGEGILHAAPPAALPAGILFLSAASEADLLAHPACKLLLIAWREHGAIVGEGDDLRTYLRKGFFAYHKSLYENRPIYFPLSSSKRSFVAWCSIHRWRDDTLQVLLADHLMPERRRLEGELEDLRIARAGAGTKGKAEKRYADVQKLLEELTDFIAKITECAEKGPPPPDDKTPRRETDARYVMDLDDGVMVNSAALWPLLEPQWKDPKKWWKELATAQGRKDYDWSHLAARYFPTRVRAKCHDDPSLGVAHTCFWALHPAKAYAWELRLQDEIRPGFTIDEPGSDEARAKFLAEHAKQAEELRAAEQKRRERKAAKADDESENGPLFDQDAGEASEADEAADA